MQPQESGEAMPIVSAAICSGNGRTGALFPKTPVLYEPHQTS